MKDEISGLFFLIPFCGIIKCFKKGSIGDNKYGSS
jgi:hypothetical protein